MCPQKEAKTRGGKEGKTVQVKSKSTELKRAPKNADAVKKSTKGKRKTPTKANVKNMDEGFHGSAEDGNESVGVGTSFQCIR